MEMVKHYLKLEAPGLTATKSKPAVYLHRGLYFLGSYQPIIPKYPDIVLCAHTSRSPPKEFVDALIEVSPRIIFIIDDDLDLAMRQDILRMDGKRLTRLTPEQTVYANEYMKNVNIHEM